MQQNEAIQNDQFVRHDLVKQQTTMCKPFLRKQIAKGLFPRAIKLSERVSVWLQSEITAFLNARIAGISNDELKDLVKELEAARKSTGGNV